LPRNPGPAATPYAETADKAATEESSDQRRAAPGEARHDLRFTPKDFCKELTISNP
jgi:hypothetical protein